MEDHRFEGRAVLPAVEALRVLARLVKKFAPQTDITAAADATFDKFLFLPPAKKSIEALCSIASSQNGITAVLETKTRVRRAAFSRIKTHVAVRYPVTEPAGTAWRPRTFSLTGEDSLEIPAAQIYRELVPFGPAYHNIVDNLTVFENGATAKLRAPIIDEAVEETLSLGSPFVLDAAFHTACVWGQRYGGMVAFPVAVEKRVVVNPTRPGGTYTSTAVPVRTDSDGLIFDICICDEDNTLFEYACGVHMRDVSGGRMKPPEWIIEDKR
jgi:hypothetical protein